MKKYLFLLLLPALAFVSCDDDDGYSLDKFWISLATVENPQNEPYFYLHLDNGDILWTAASNFYNYRPRTGQRILADYTILNDKPEGSGYDHDVRLNDAYSILTKGIFTVTPATQDSIGYDPIVLGDTWIGSDFLNVRLAYYGYNQRHMLNLVRDPEKVYTDNKVHLELRHNAFNDNPTYLYYSMVSFNLTSLQALPRTQPIDIVVHYKDYDGVEHTREFTYNYVDKSTETRTFDREYYESVKTVEID